MNLLYDLVANILAAFYAFIPNYAIAIVLLTVLVMAITTPLTLKSTRSMMVMQKLQPEMKKIQARYKDDRQKQNEELLKFYKENNINPLGGCIPLIVQMPVFFFLYQILRGLTRRVSDVGFSVGFNSGQTAIGTNITTAPQWFTPFDPAYLDHSSKLYQSLQGSTSMTAFGMDLSLSLSETYSTKGVLASIPYVLLIAIVAFTSFYQQRQIQGRNPNATINPQQQTLMKIMPVILPVISISLPAGLVLYFAVSNLWRVGLQAFISRSIYGIKRGDKPAAPEVDKGGSKGAKAGADKDAPRAPKPGQRGGDAKGSSKGQQTKKADQQAKKSAAKKDQGSGNGANGRTKQPVSSKSGGGRRSSSGPGRADNTKKNAGASKSRSSSRSSRSSGTSGSGSSSRGGSSGGGASPSLQPRARKPKKR